MYKKVSFVATMALAISMIGLSSCNKKMVKTDMNDTMEAATIENNSDDQLSLDLQSITGAEWKEIPQLSAVYFGLDQADINTNARQGLQDNAKLLMAHPDVQIQVSGHCDERGTVEYNIALGDRRATSVKKYYKNLGISEKRLTSVSYGEERPTCQDANENCWAKNRRVETRVRILPTAMK